MAQQSRAPPQIMLSMAPMNPTFSRSAYAAPPSYPTHGPPYTAPGPQQQYAHAHPPPYSDLQMAQRLQADMDAGGASRPRRAAARQAEELLKVCMRQAQPCIPHVLLHRGVSRIQRLRTSQRLAAKSLVRIVQQPCLWTGAH